jgi:hypothetical protein
MDGPFPRSYEELTKDENKQVLELWQNIKIALVV